MAVGVPWCMLPVTDQVPVAGWYSSRRAWRRSDPGYPPRTADQRLQHDHRKGRHRTAREIVLTCVDYLQRDEAVAVGAEKLDDRWQGRDGRRVAWTGIVHQEDRVEQGAALLSQPDDALHPVRRP